ncbi:holo-ACP synthase [Sedimentibacter sp. zth1]|uniref:holo-ACP synthase n=1 Tax=Sedimentibacter sp. zth1 TaxID=2816908 RepID=UPI001A926786|nr:holo-ACP synthase [Sedimentibacter sp. zth1]QSX06047.1 holo-ACP synthase [Sedimentibacter sp. zth1]
MVFGTGIDIVQINRIEKLLNNKNFINKVYTKKEQDYLDRRKYNPQTAAGIFAAKEAISKALGTGIAGFNITDLEIQNDESGRPYVVLYNNALKLSIEKCIVSINISISHEKEYAVSIAIAEIN